MPNCVAGIAREGWASKWLRAVAVGSLCVLGAVACNSDRLTIPNYGNPTPGALASDPISNVQFRVNGILDLNRRNMLAWVNNSGIFGRESFNYFLTDSRVTANYLDKPAIDPGGTAAGDWNGRFSNLRAIHALIGVVDSAPSVVFNAQQKSAALGFAHTMNALELSYVVMARDSLGSPVDITDDPRALSPFVSRDSVYNYIVGELDAAKTELQAGGAAFPFRLNSGFTGFDTPATFLQFNRALAARINAYRASLGIAGCGAPLSSACYTIVLQNLTESFVNGGGSLNTGVYDIYSSAANDVPNQFSPALTQNYVAHPSIGPDAPLRADGTPDLRYQTKIRRLSAPRAYPTPGISIPTDYAFALYPLPSSPIPIIRNEELILLRAEARYFTGDIAGATSDINLIRTTSGGLSPISGFANQGSFITELLLQNRYSLLWEGHRWVDVRRFNRLNTLPIDIPSRQFVASRQPIPTAECLARVGSKFPAPGC
ncbi:MAG: RagB/SusD family nutrient uptake outer membrane protein [Gemmatimonadaceae bacterium]